MILVGLLNVGLKEKGSGFSNSISNSERSKRMALM